MATAALFGVDTRQNLAFQAFALALGLLLVARLQCLRLPGSYRAHRLLPRHATVGEPCSYRVTVENLGTRARPGLTLVEEPPDPRPDLDTFLSTPAPNEAKINAWDRLLGYPRWRWLLWRERRMEPAESALPTLPPGIPVDVRLTVTPLRRGYLRLAGLQLARPDAIGLCRALRPIGEAQRLLVLPRRYPVPSFALPGSRRLQPGGVSLAASIGDSREFMSLREYRTGDSPRHVHWPASARLGRPVVREYQDEYFSRQALILDTFTPTSAGVAFEAAVSVAASVLEPLQGRETLVDLMFVADEAYRFTGGRGLLSTQRLLEILACVEPCTGQPFRVLKELVEGHASALSAAVCVFLAWDQDHRELVDHLRALGLSLRVFLIGVDAALDPGSRADDGSLLTRLDPERLAADLASR